ncbi:MAG: hypothetical protein AAF799_02835 [Myxococcota bacterium]
MFQIRDEQLAALASADRARFTADVVQQVLRVHPPSRTDRRERGEEQGRLHRLVSGLIDRAVGYGIDDETDVAGFVLLSVERGSGFELRTGFEWARTLLEQVELSGAEKTQLLQSRLSWGWGA